MSDARKGADELFQAIRGWIGRSLDIRDARLDAIETRLAKVESKGVQYRGMWQAAQSYKRGDLVTLDSGGLWHANAETTAVPGDDVASWTMMIPRP